MKYLNYTDLGMIDYATAWDIQRTTFEERYQRKTVDTLFLLEHPNTYTLGKTADRNNLVGSKEFLEDNGIKIYDIDRGGDITYHGPGQIVGYPIIDLNEWFKDTHKYLRAIEETIMMTLAYYNIASERNEKYTGVWIEDRKIAAIGVKVSKWITMHGFAFNINTDLKLFNGIIPCGIKEKEVTSLQKELGNEVDINEVKELLLHNFAKVFDYSGVIRKENKLLVEI